jgi:hypothetical protein
MAAIMAAPVAAVVGLRIGVQTETTQTRDELEATELGSQAGRAGDWATVVSPPVRAGRGAAAWARVARAPRHLRLRLHRFRRIAARRSSRRRARSPRPPPSRP